VEVMGWQTLWEGDMGLPDFHSTTTRVGLAA